MPTSATTFKKTNFLSKAANDHVPVSKTIG